MCDQYDLKLIVRKIENLEIEIKKIEQNDYKTNDDIQKLVSLKKQLKIAKNDYETAYDFAVQLAKSMSEVDW